MGIHDIGLVIQFRWVLFGVNETKTRLLIQDNFLVK